LARIFENGFTTKTYGHGFGLHTAANQIEELGGRVTARSDGLGTGATFVLDLPLQPPRRAAS
jgi:signal transduction histidine kinase